MVRWDSRKELAPWRPPRPTPTPSTAWSLPPVMISTLERTAEEATSANSAPRPLPPRHAPSSRQCRSPRTSTAIRVSPPTPWMHCPTVGASSTPAPPILACRTSTPAQHTPHQAATPCTSTPLPHPPTRTKPPCCHRLTSRHTPSTVCNSQWMSGRVPLPLHSY